MIREAQNSTRRSLQTQMSLATFYGNWSVTRQRAFIMSVPEYDGRERWWEGARATGGNFDGRAAISLH